MPGEYYLSVKATGGGHSVSLTNEIITINSNLIAYCTPNAYSACVVAFRPLDEKKGKYFLLIDFGFGNGEMIQIRCYYKYIKNEFRLDDYDVKYINYDATNNTAKSSTGTLEMIVFKRRY